MQHKKNKEAAVVVFSGGQDSTTCLLYAKKHYKKVYAVSFDYHQRHVAELDAAKEICEKLDVEQTIMDMTLLNQLRFAQPGFPIQKSAGHRIFAPHRCLSQLITSFFGSQCQGIHPAPFLA